METAAKTPKPNRKDFTKPFSESEKLVLFDSKGYAKQAEKYIVENQYKIDMHEELVKMLVEVKKEFMDTADSNGYIVSNDSIWRKRISDLLNHAFKLGY